MNKHKSRLNQDVESIIPAEDIAWSKMQHARIRDGGVWGVPRSGLLMQRNPAGFSLRDVAPYDIGLEIMAAGGADVPASAAELLAYQKKDFGFIQARFEAAGLVFDDPKNLLGSPSLETLQATVDQVSKSIAGDTK